MAEYLNWSAVFKREISDRHVVESIPVKKRFLGIPYGTKKIVGVGFFMFKLEWAQWIARLAKHTTNAVAVYEARAGGQVVYYLRSFKTEGEFALDELRQRWPSAAT